jgi:hypothetical protein
MTLRDEIASDTSRIVSEHKTDSADMRLVFALLVVAIFGTCAITNATEDSALAACYSAGFSPTECER